MRPVDADELWRVLSARDFSDEVKCEILATIVRMPTADREDGVWINEIGGYDNGEFIETYWTCSNCETEFDEWETKPTWNYCPNCGAYMRSKDDERRPNQEKRCDKGIHT